MRLKLMELRKAAGYKNRDDFAALLGVNKYTYRSWESGSAMMNAEQVWTCCEALHTDPNTLLGWYDEHPADVPERPAILESYAQLSEEGQEVAQNVVAGLVDRYPSGDGADGMVDETA